MIVTILAEYVSKRPPRKPPWNLATPLIPSLGSSALVGVFVLPYEIILHVLDEMPKMDLLCRYHIRSKWFMEVITKFGIISASQWIANL